MRKSRQWIEFCNQRSDALDVAVMDFPRLVTPAVRLSAHTVLGRDGCVYSGDFSQSPFEITRTLRFPHHRLQAVQAWLQGAGALILSVRPDAAYDARILKEIEFRRLLPGEASPWECKVCFHCQPHPALTPAAAPSVFTTSGGELPTPAGMIALPRVTIEGSGTFTLSIGGQSLRFTDVEGGVIVDSELGDAFTLDGGAPANEHVSGALFRLEDGLNVVRWIEGGDDETGHVERVSILPKWRFA